MTRHAGRPVPAGAWRPGRLALLALPVLLAAPVMTAAAPADPAAGIIHPPTRPPARATAAQPLPAVALLVDWRSQPAAAPVAAAGGWSVGTAHPVPPGWQATSTRPAAAAGAPVQTLRVQNGHEARLRIDQPHDETRVDLVWSPVSAASAAASAAGRTDAGQGLASREVTVHDVMGLRALPRWPGGSAEVELQVTIERQRPAAAPGARPDVGAQALGADGLDLQLGTVLRLPFGQWQTVAQLGEAGDSLQVRVRRP